MRVVWLSLLVACQSEEHPVSGHPYICVCVFPPEPPEADAVLDVCAVTTGEAMEIARSCVVDKLELPEARYCDCAADEYRFCAIGACTFRQ
jgi:hypothetical protein